MSLLLRLPIAVVLSAVLSVGSSLGKDVPKPKLKPDVLVVKPTPVDVAITPLHFPAENGRWPERTVVQERSLCAKLLTGLALTYEPLAPLGQPDGCGAAAPILISAIGRTRIVPPAEATCVFAEQLHGWVTSSLQPAAKNLLGRDLVQIDNASAYVCRRRNNFSSGKLSEHAKANALDIAQLQFSGAETTSVAGDWSGLGAKVGTSKKAMFLAQIRRDACIRFTTVLGPGSDKYHGDHFHIDYARRKSGYRICK